MYMRISPPTIAVRLSTAPVPLATTHVQAGFPSPADDYTERPLDLNELFKVDAADSYFVRAEGTSMKDAGIQSGDILCVQRGRSAHDNDIVIAVIDNEFTVKRFRMQGTTPTFLAANSDFPTLIPADGQSVSIWGVVTGLARIFNT
jgi:DNA polymerase V